MQKFVKLTLLIYVCLAGVRERAARTKKKQMDALKANAKGGKK